MKRLNEALNGYMTDFLAIYIRENGLDYDKADQYIKNKKYLDILEEDLEDKGFSTEEAQSIVIRSLDKETAYKFMVYYILLCDSWETLEELKTVIVDGLVWSLDDFTEEDLNMLVKYRYNVDFS